MRILAAGLLFMGAMALSCASPYLGDAGADVPPAAAMTFDVPASNGGAAPPLCPGQLFVTASQSPGNATCTQAPEECVGSQDPASNTIVCNCYASSGGSGAGVWSCRQANP